MRAVLIALLLTGSAWAGPSTAPGEAKPQIQWFGTLETALNEAKRTNRPILMTSAAPACSGVSGVW